MSFWYLIIELWIIELRCDNLCHTSLCQLAGFFLSDLDLLDWCEILHVWSLICWDAMWIFLDFYVAFSIWLIFFISIGQLCKFMWYMFEYLVWNAHMVLDEHEIWYDGCRHIVGHPCFGPIHFLTVFIDLWIFEVNACVDVMIWLE